MGSLQGSMGVQAWLGSCWELLWKPTGGLLQPGGPVTQATLSQVEVSRRVTLEKLPPVLVLHLKRFVYEKTGGCQKLVKNIEYPVDLEISRGNAGLCLLQSPQPVAAWSPVRTLF